MSESGDQATARAEQIWAETLRRQSPFVTPTTSVTAARVRTDIELAKRIRSAVRARSALADTPEAEGADYVIGPLLGAGGMGRVFVARQIALDRTVALKILRPELHANTTARDEFLAEALVSANLDHPNTLPIYDIGLTHDENLFYSMKLVRGARWSNVVGEKSLEENLDILCKVCDAVSFAHDKGVIHRDLKPDNVMVGHYGEVLLMDWGLAASVGSAHARRLDANYPMAGTPAYMSPEVAACEVDKIGKSSDVYLLGAILYQIVTGLMPHGGATVLECVLAAMRNELQPTTKSGELLDVALRAMSKNPDDRHGSAREFAIAVGDFLSHQISSNYTTEACMRFEALPGLSADDFYRECEEIIALLQRALISWPDNLKAARRLVWLRETFAAVALRRGEIQLARSSARAAERECQAYHIDSLPPDDVAERIKASLIDRDRGSVNLRT